MRRPAALVFIAILSVSRSARAQSDVDMAALEARLMAKLERRLAEESANTNAQVGALRVAVQDAVRTLSKSVNDLDRKVLVAIDSGATKDGLATLEARAGVRDSAVELDREHTGADGNQESRLKARAEEWKQIGALAFLDSTDRAISAYQQALAFAPNDAQILNQLGELYMRKARWDDRIAVGERLTHLKSPESQAEGYFNIADSYLEQNHPSKVRKEGERCLTLARAASVSRLESKCLSLLAGANGQEGNFARAEQLAGEALRVARSGGHAYEEIMALFMIAATSEQAVKAAPVERRRAALQDVDKKYADVERAVLKNGDPVAAAGVLVNRARLALGMGDAPLAESRLRKALKSMEETGATGRVGYVEQQLGQTLVAQSRIDEAVPYFQRSVLKAQQGKEPGYEAMALMAWAQAEAARSNKSEACRLAQQSYRVFVEGVPELRTQHERAAQQVKQLCEAVPGISGGVSRGKGTARPIQKALTRADLEKLIANRTFQTKVRLGNALLSDSSPGVSRGFVDTVVYPDGRVLFSLVDTIFSVYRTTPDDVSRLCRPNRGVAWVPGNFGSIVERFTLCEIESGTLVRVVGIVIRGNRLELELSAGGDYARLKFMLGKDWQRTMVLDEINEALSLVLVIR